MVTKYLTVEVKGDEREARLAASIVRGAVGEAAQRASQQFPDVSITWSAS